jgi:hypothetical protein
MGQMGVYPQPSGEAAGREGKGSGDTDHAVNAPMPPKWPNGKRFAFSVFDDTDFATIANVRPVYELLADLGFRTTKSVWPLHGEGRPKVGGTTCEDLAYRQWAQMLQHEGFEIALHNVTFHTSPREQTILGLDRFQELFGQDPSIHTNHTGCRESIYWTSDRLSGVNKSVYNLLNHLNRFKTREQSEGHVEASPLFWGDICRERIKYVRNFVHSDANTLACCPEMPYHDANRPYVKYWFASTEGCDVETYVRALSDRQLDKLEREGGACIMYTHFAAGFAPDGHTDARFARVMRRLSERNGWFVPVTTLLDFLLETRGHHEITDRERGRLERRWLAHKVRIGTS